MQEETKRFPRWATAGLLLAAVAAAFLLLRSGRAGEDDPERAREVAEVTESADAAVDGLGQAVAALEEHFRKIQGRDVDVPEWMPEPAEEFDAARIQELVAIYEAGDETRRHGVMEALSVEFPLYAERAGEAADPFLPFFRRVMASPVRLERQLASIALHGPSSDGVVALLAEVLASEHPLVRFYAAEGLAWCVRAGNTRAEAPLLAALEHGDPRVRAMAAISIATISPRLPGAREALASRLAAEEDRRSLQGLASALAKLDTEEGAAAARLAVAGRESTVRSTVEGALTRLAG